MVVVCRCDSLPQGGLDHRYMDLADTFFHMGFDPALVHIYVDLQVCIWLILYTQQFFKSLSCCSNIWPTLPVAAVFVGMDKLVFSSAVFWLGLFLIPVATILIDVVVKV